MDHRVDVAIVGAGTAGIGAWRAAKRNGASVMMIDPGPHGTTCARVGCMPSKLLIAAANATHNARTAEIFGVHADVRVDGPAVMRRVQSERDRFVSFVLKVMGEMRENGELIEERAEIAEPGVLRAGEHLVQYDRLVIATGTRSFVPRPFRDLPDDVMLTNESIFELEDLPESLLVVGLGVIGIELGQAMARLGVRVTFVGVGGALGSLTDPEVLARARDHFGDVLDLHTDYTFGSIAAVDGGVRFEFTDSKGGARDESYARVLMAAGRVEALDDFGLEKLGVAKSADGWPIDPLTMQLADLPVFVAGDVNSLHPLMHEAVDDGRAAGTNAANFPELIAPTRRVPLGIIFSDPQIAVVGKGYEQLAACENSAGVLDFRRQGRARVDNVGVGLVRIYADEKTQRLVGAEMFGPRVEHMAHLLAWAIGAELTVQEALDMPFYHPVLEEGLRTALRSLAANIGAGERVRCAVSELGVGS